MIKTRNFWSNDYVSTRTGFNGEPGGYWFGLTDQIETGGASTVTPDNDSIADAMTAAGLAVHYTLVKDTLSGPWAKFMFNFENSGESRDISMIATFSICYEVSIPEGGYMFFQMDPAVIPAGESGYVEYLSHGETCLEITGADMRLGSWSKDTVSPMGPTAMVNMGVVAVSDDISTWGPKTQMDFDLRIECIGFDGYCEAAGCPRAGAGVVP